VPPSQWTPEEKKWIDAYQMFSRNQGYDFTDEQAQKTVDQMRQGVSLGIPPSEWTKTERENVEGIRKLYEKQGYAFTDEIAQIFVKSMRRTIATFMNKAQAMRAMAEQSSHASNVNVPESLTVDSPADNSQDKTVFVLVEKKESGKWEFIKMSLDRPQYTSKQQEILEVDRYSGFDIYPSFEKTNEWTFLGGNQSEGDSGSNAMNMMGTYQCKVRSDETKYTPCHSGLTHFLNTDMFFLAGNTRYGMSPDSLMKLVREANLESEIKACREKYYDYAIGLINNPAAVKPKIIDDNRSYDGSQLFEMKPANYDCLIADKKDIKFTLQLTSPSYDLRADKAVYTCRDSENCVIQPIITILAKHTSGPSVANGPIQTVIVKSQYKTIALRSAPSMDKPVIENIPGGMEILKISENADWVQVRLDMDDGSKLEGWVRKDMVDDATRGLHDQ